MVATESQAASSNLRKMVCFYLDGQEYAADIDDVSETMTIRPITPVFLTPRWLSGIINLRGDIVAVIDLAQLLGLRPTLLTDESRIVVARYLGPERQSREKLAGIVVDRMAELRTIDVATLQQPPPTLTESLGLLAGLCTVEGGAAVRVLKLPALFESEQLRAFQRKS
jgi:purine-binding chemotaxis protein CheW